jgi:PAS domain-containing protein
VVTQTIAEDELLELYDFFQNAPIGVQFLRADATIGFANEADLRLTGYAEAPEEYLGRDFAAQHGEAATAQAMRDAWERGEPVFNMHATLTDRDGAPRRVVIHATGRLDDGELVGACCFTFPEPGDAPHTPPPGQPVAEALQDKSAQERYELHERLVDAFENAPLGLHIVGADGLIRRANRMELSRLGYADAPETYIGHHIEEFHAEQAVIDDMLERLVGGRPLTHYNATLRAREGETLPVIIYSSPRFDDGEFVNTRCFTFPKSVDTGVTEQRFGWPRNEPAGADGPAAGELTNVLQRLAGRKHAEESLGFLAATSRALGATYDLGDALQAVCRLAIPFMGEACAVELTTGGSPERVAAAGDGVPPDPSAPDGGLRASFATRDGAEGAVVLRRGEYQPPYGAADRALAEELARRVAAAVENGRLRDRLAAAGL